MKVIELVGISCDQCSSYYFTVPENRKSVCPKCNNEVDLIVCDKELCEGCDKIDSCSAYRSSMECISGL